MGMEYEFNPDVRLTVDRCFKKFLKKIPQSQAVSKAVHYKTLLEFVNKASPKVSLMTSFLYQTSMRVSPMCNAKLSDLEPLEGEDGYRIRIVQKNGVLTTPKVKAHLIRQIIAECKSKVYLFENKFGRPYNRTYVYNLFVKESLQHVGERINPHRLRHSHATHTNDIRAAQRQGGWRNGKVMLDTYSIREYKLEDLPTLDPVPQVSQNTVQAPAFNLGQANTLEQLLEQKAKAEALLLDINNRLLVMSGENVAPEEPKPLLAYTPNINPNNALPQAQLERQEGTQINGHSHVFNGKLNSKLAVTSDEPVVSRLAHTGCFEKGKYKPLNISNGFGYNGEKQESESHSHTLSKCKSCGQQAKTYQQGKCKSCLAPSLRATNLLINQFQSRTSFRKAAASSSRLSRCMSCRKLGYIYQNDKCQGCLSKSLRATNLLINQSQSRKKAVCI